jgi:hypothetical protein
MIPLSKIELQRPDFECVAQVSKKRNLGQPVNIRPR